MNIAIVTIGYNLPGYTQRLIDTAQCGCRDELTWIVFSHSAFPEKIHELETLATRSNVVLKDYRKNRGICKSLNEGILAAKNGSHDVIMVVNEDVIFAEGDISKLAAAAVSQRDRYIVCGRAFHHDEAGWSSSRYGCYAINPLALERLGCFDENIFPIYYDDTDYRRRAHLAGLTEGYCADTSIEHEGSACLRHPEVAAQNRLTYACNRDYYIRKWGGDGGQETFDRPFNDSQFTCHIAPEVREHPYSQYDRVDQHIVRF